jgi:uncharacterized protein (TIGR02996 family)
MSSEEAFLQAILKDDAHEVSASRMAYSDWLEERGETQRAELIRVCEAMRRVPVFSDDYWRLKARRNDLRPACPADWLAATRYDGSRYVPLFRDGIPTDCVGRWRLIREFTERWHGIPMGDVGGRSGEVRAAEQRLGRTLPPSVREYVAYTYDVGSRQTGGITRRGDISMELTNGHSTLSVLFQDGHLRWSMPYAHLSREDPPVYASFCGFDDDDTEPLPIEGTGPQAESLSAFVLGIVDQYKPDGGHFETWVREDLDLRNALGESFPIRVAHHKTMYAGGTSIVDTVFRQRATIYEGEGILAWLSDWHVHGGSDLRVCAHPSLTSGAVPAFLWEYARRDTQAGGVFLTGAERPVTRTD